MNNFIKINKEFKEIHLSDFNRNQQLELKIDKELAQRGKSGIHAYLDNICEYSNLINNQQESHRGLCSQSINDLRKILGYCQSNITQVHVSALSNELREHYLSIKDYVSKLHNQFVGKQVYLEDILNEINGLISNTNTNSSLEYIRKLISEHPLLDKKIESICKFEGHLTVLLNKGKVRIHIISNLKSYDYNFFYSSYLFFLNNVVDDGVIEDLIKKDISIKGIFINREDKYLLNTTIVDDSLRSLKKLENLINGIDEKVYLKDFIHSIELAKQRIQELQGYYQHFNFESLGYIESPNLKGVKDSIKLLRRDFLKLLSRDHESILNNTEQIQTRVLLEESRRNLLLLINRIETSYHFDDNLMYCLEQIKQNNTLYLLSNGGKKSEQNSFGEENLSGIVASNLRAMYRKEKHVSINTELYLGCGRTDITIKSNNKIMGHIEFKLIKSQEDIKSKTKDAIFQLFDRYSENDGLDNRYHTGHYLVLFAHDKRFDNFSNKIKEGIQEYVAKQGLNFSLLNKYKTENRFSFTLTQSRSPFSDKVREITVVICNLEVDHQSRKKEAKRKNTYTP